MSLTTLSVAQKCIFDAIEGSLERLGTYVDVIQIHQLGRESPREEIMKSLIGVVESGNVRYDGVLLDGCLGISGREDEHEMIPYCLDSGVGIIPQSSLARGVLPTPRSTKTSVHAHTDFPIGFAVLTRDKDVGEKIVVVWRSWRERRGLAWRR
ncbi:hypothetical protein PAAG_02674 [Paracoccidioides lutzii Pb01]|uniref:NADP-dependent oxidoreductase domain-containing protein n=1 Tax=Paracoccidioides lutzii (strain ATCC MYA-826 / Pb01) TaxID=502779 RepID=C1GVX9_PARBA|nr:hypothetical protein PAAG_02674 [Paracoccidioides lutzii Pb01]EEH40698.2 hypothetical protein PAAG_02674 [Paracoccidioides lutzii Pb01]